jgi:hypothetical protein
VLPEPEEFRLKAKDGRKVSGQGVRSGQREAASWELKFEFPAGFEAAALEVTHFQGVGEHPVPFDFKDVPLK